MEVIVIGIIVLTMLWALVSGAIAVSEGWKYCMQEKNSSQFFPVVMERIAGNKLAVVGILILCIPVWILLSVIIASRK